MANGLKHYSPVTKNVEPCNKTVRDCPYDVHGNTVEEIEIVIATKYGDVQYYINSGLASENDEWINDGLSDDEITENLRKRANAKGLELRQAYLRELNEHTIYDWEQEELGDDDYYRNIDGEELFLNALDNTDTPTEYPIEEARDELGIDRDIQDYPHLMFYECEHAYTPVNATGVGASGNKLWARSDIDYRFYDNPSTMFTDMRISAWAEYEESYSSYSSFDDVAHEVSSLQKNIINDWNNNPTVLKYEEYEEKLEQLVSEQDEELASFVDAKFDEFVQSHDFEDDFDDYDDAQEQLYDFIKEAVEEKYEGASEDTRDDRSFGLLGRFGAELDENLRWNVFITEPTQALDGSYRKISAHGESMEERMNDWLSDYWDKRISDYWDERFADKEVEA